MSENFFATLNENYRDHYHDTLLSIRDDEFAKAATGKLFTQKGKERFIPITYGEFFDTALLLAGFIKSEKFRIKIRLSNRADFFLTAAAVMLSGKSAVLIPSESKGDDLYRVEDASEIFDEEKLNDLIRDFPYSGNTGNRMISKNNFDSVAGSLSDLDELAVIFTSGSTSQPKAVPLTGFNFHSSFKNTRTLFPYKPGDKWYLSLPPYHIGGFSVFIRAILSGMEVICGESDPERQHFYDELESTGCSYVSLVPTQLHRICKNNLLAPHSLRYALIGGAPADSAMIKKADSLNWPLYVVYGMTETAAFFAGGRVTGSEKPGYAGKPLGECSLTVKISQNEERSGGLIMVKSGAAASGYLNDDKETDYRFSVGGFITSDSGFTDEEGNLYITGRTDDVIITGGKKVNPAEVEEAIRKVLPGINTAVAGVEDDEWGQKVIVFIESDQNKTDYLRSELKKSLESHKVPKDFIFIRQFTLKGPGKTDKAALLKYYSEQKGSV